MWIIGLIILIWFCIPTGIVIPPTEINIEVVIERENPWPPWAPYQAFEGEYERYKRKIEEGQ